MKKNFQNTSNFGSMSLATKALLSDVMVIWIYMKQLIKVKYNIPALIVINDNSIIIQPIRPKNFTVKFLICYVILFYDYLLILGCAFSLFVHFKIGMP